MGVWSKLMEGAKSKIDRPITHFKKVITKVRDHLSLVRKLEQMSDRKEIDQNLASHVCDPLLRQSVIMSVAALDSFITDKFLSEFVTLILRCCAKSDFPMKKSILESFLKKIYRNDQIS